MLDAFTKHTQGAKSFAGVSWSNETHTKLKYGHVIPLWISLNGNILWCFLSNHFTPLNCYHKGHRQAANKRWKDATEWMLWSDDLCVCVCPCSGHRGCVYCGASVLQQPGCHRQPESPQEAQSLSLQEGNRDLQLLLFQHHTGCQTQQTGRETRAEKYLSVTHFWLEIHHICANVTVGL